MQYSSSVPSVVAPGSILTCSRCSHRWAVRKRGDLPKNCPKCRSTLWMKNYRVYTCLKCEHSWGTANENPLRCPKCHTSKWNCPAVARDPKDDPVVSRLAPEIKDRVYSEYTSGKGAMKISLECGLAFGDVMDALVEKFPDTAITI